MAKTTSRNQPDPVRVYLEQGRSWVFAGALDWPGWCRRGKGDQAALDTLLDYADRYALVAGPDFGPGPLTVVGRVPGSVTTDFGAPASQGPWDDEPLAPAEADRLVGLLEASWRYFDAVTAQAPERLRKGPGAAAGTATRSSITSARPSGATAASSATGSRRAPRGRGSAR